MRIHIANLTVRIAKRKRLDNSRFRLAAVIAQGSRVFAFGINTNKPPGTIPSSIHAEDACLRRVPVMNGGDLYVARVLANGNISMAKPCPACMEIIKNHGIDTIHYTNRDGGWSSIELRYGDK